MEGVGASRLLSRCGSAQSFVGPDTSVSHITPCLLSPGLRLPSTPSSRNLGHPNPTPSRDNGRLSEGSLRVRLPLQITDLVVIWQTCNRKPLGEEAVCNSSPRLVSTQGQGARPTGGEPQGRLSVAPPLEGARSLFLAEARARSL